MAMKNPNGYGSVYKLSGKRRRPYIAQKTRSWEINPETGKARQCYDIIGYYETRKDALEALALYNANPHNLASDHITFSEVYERWANEHFPTISHSNVNCYKAAWNLCSSIAGMRFVDVKLDHLQAVVDGSGKNTPTLRKLKVLFSAMYKWAVIHEIIPKERNLVEYVNIKDAGNPNAYNRQPFSKAEVGRLWDVYPSNEYYEIILMLIYTGCRISELLDLKKSDVFLSERYFNITQAKTAAGVRSVPISKKIVPFFEKWLVKNDCEYLVSTPDGQHFLYRNYYDSYWLPLCEALSMHHRPHDARHTCISMLTVAGVSDKVIKKIVGHKGQSVTEVVYTHFEIEELINAIDKI